MTIPKTAGRFDTPYGTFHLERYPKRSDETLLAWCSADALLLEETHRRQALGADILTVNDMHGALCVALQPKMLWTDSALSALALKHNEGANMRAQTPVIWSTEKPHFRPALVVLRIPKQRHLFEHQLSQLAKIVAQGSTVLAAGMDKHLSPHTADILERYIGPTQRRPGHRKARLFIALRDERHVQQYAENSTYHCEALGTDLHSLPNVFSREKLDLGTRFLLEQLQTIAPAQKVIDLACGNGIVGLVALEQGLASQVTFCDESAMALQSARLNANRIFPNMEKHLSFHLGDGLLQYQEKPAHLILCNPPFHLGHTVDEFAGRHLLRQCSRHLQPSGQLYLVANRHIDYRPSLRQTFDRVEKFASNAKFNILVAQNF